MTIDPAQQSQDLMFMELALGEARRAEALGEVPIGALVVESGRIVGRGCNYRETSNDPTTHAEMLAIREAAAALNSWRLLDTTLYVTLEPCVMCMGAIILARIPRLVFACRDPRAGAVGSIYDFSQDPRFNHRVAVTEGVLQQECSALLSGFFRRLREDKRRKRAET
ncbi:adenosine deaminase [Geoalkalibacter ferrihydriticus DSM 17813]|uniref:tRNA-specific adenosine deaminase n=2 Tax=Geoalkalibacter ferrihydriticus TaxID=392333 RepID=A0A0C2HRY6_9BACT|nr:tRNA adenosine(34) deaminase TadA [Geoalkalibacter ferrihydriticus]KIH77585.1 adenosine deaminase [Geoalkalibacter ferrihydriticus DSM 17813]